MNCPKCKTVITNEKAVFCPTCGEKLVTEEIATVTNQATESNSCTQEAETTPVLTSDTNTAFDTAPKQKKCRNKILIAAIAALLVIAVIVIAVWNPFTSKPWTYDSFCEASKEWVTNWKLDTDRSTASSEVYSFTPSNAETTADLFSLTFACEDNRVTYANVSFFLDDNGEYELDAQFFPLCMLDKKIASMWKDAAYSSLINETDLGKSVESSQGTFNDAFIWLDNIKKVAHTDYLNGKLTDSASLIDQIEYSHATILAHASSTEFGTLVRITTTYK